MSAKTSPARRRAFFAALAATGNQTLAAERAKVSRSWVSLHRAADPGFRAELEAALATARARLRDAPTVRPGERWGTQGGEELAVRGTKGRRVQIARARVRQWTPRVEARFLTTLASTCNVKAACAAVGLSQASAYGHRKRWSGFERRWHQALVTGYDRLHEALLDGAGRLFADVPYDDDAPLPPMQVADVLQLLSLHRYAARGSGGRPGRVARPQRPSAASVDATLVAALDRHDRQQAQAAARRAKRAAARAAAAGAATPAAKPDRGAA